MCNESPILMMNIMFQRYSNNHVLYMLPDFKSSVQFTVTNLANIEGCPQQHLICESLHFFFFKLNFREIGKKLFMLLGFPHTVCGIFFFCVRLQLQSYYGKEEPAKVRG